VNHTGYKWLTIFATNETALSDVFLKKLFNTANIYILASTSLFYPGLYEFKMLVRSKEDKFIFFLYGLKCRLTNFLCFQDDLRVWRFAKKKCVSLKSEVGDFIYYIHSEKKRMVFYQHIGGVIKKIGKTKFDLLKQSLPVKQKKNSVFVNC
jgi:hypothetical protein